MAKQTIRKTLLKTVSFAAAVIFASTSVVYPETHLSSVSIAQGPVTSKIQPEKISVPEEFGSVQSAFFGGPDRPFVIFLQDAHAVVDAQTSIQNLIRYFSDSFGVDLVALEGGKGKLDPTLLRTFPGEEIKKNVLEEYRAKGELAGTEMAAVTNPSEASYFGIEDWKLYEAHYVAYLRAVKEQGALLADIKAAEEDLDRERVKIYSPEHNEFHEKVRSFRDERQSLLEFLRFLKEFRSRAAETPNAGKNNFPELMKLMDSIEKDESFDGEALAVEVRWFADAFNRDHLSRISREKGREFNGKYQDFLTDRMDAGVFLRYLTETAESAGVDLKITERLKELLAHKDILASVKGTKVFDELAAFIAGWESALSAGPVEKELSAKYGRLSLLKDLVKLELDREKVEQFQASPPDYLSLLPEASRLAPYLEFYRYALARDAALQKNLEGLMEHEKRNAAIVVLGGFHRKGFEKRLREKGISYCTVSPAMGNLKGAENYGPVMEGKLSYADELTTTFYDAFMKHSVLKLSQGLNEPDFRRTIKLWRDTVLRRLADEGRLSEAYRYTRYIDLMVKVYTGKFGASKLTGKNKKEILDDIRKGLMRSGENALNKMRERAEKRLGEFTDGLAGLAGKRRATVQDMKALLESSGRAKSEALAPPVLKFIEGLNSEVLKLAAESDGRITDERLAELRPERSEAGTLLVAPKDYYLAALGNLAKERSADLDADLREEAGKMASLIQKASDLAARGELKAADAGAIRQNVKRQISQAPDSEQGAFAAAVLEDLGWQLNAGGLVVPATKERGRGAGEDANSAADDTAPSIGKNFRGPEAPGAVGGGAKNTAASLGVDKTPADRGAVSPVGQVPGGTPARGKKPGDPVDQGPEKKDKDKPVAGKTRVRIWEQPDAIVTISPEARDLARKAAEENVTATAEEKNASGLDPEWLERDPMLQPEWLGELAGTEWLGGRFPEVMRERIDGKGIGRAVHVKSLCLCRPGLEPGTEEGEVIESDLDAALKGLEGLSGDDYIFAAVSDTGTHPSYGRMHWYRLVVTTVKKFGDYAYSRANPILVDEDGFMGDYGRDYLLLLEFSVKDALNEVEIDLTALCQDLQKAGLFGPYYRAACQFIRRKFSDAEEYPAGVTVRNSIANKRVKEVFLSEFPEAVPDHDFGGLDPEWGHPQTFSAKIGGAESGRTAPGTGRSLGAAGDLVKIAEAADFKPETLIAAMKETYPELAELYAGRTWIEEEDRDNGAYRSLYTVEAHTLRVMRLFEKYFAGMELPGGVSKGIFRITLALHDIGKSTAIPGSDVSQHDETFKVVKRMTFPGEYDAQIPVILALIYTNAPEPISLEEKKLRGDPIGRYLKLTKKENVSPEELKATPPKSARAVQEKAAEAGLETGDFFRLLTIYYQCDAASYTKAAGGVEALELVFLDPGEIAAEENLKWMNESGRLRFSAWAQGAYDEVEKEVNALRRGASPRYPREDFGERVRAGGREYAAWINKMGDPKDLGMNEMVVGAALAEIENNLRNLLPVLCPAGESRERAVYVPAPGFNLSKVMAGTDATRLVYADMSRDFMGYRKIDNFAALVAQIEAMGGRILPESGKKFLSGPSSGRSELEFDLPSSVDGTMQKRTLIYYAGVDATRFIPPEIIDGYDVLWLDAFTMFLDLEDGGIVWKDESGYLVPLLNDGGFVEFGNGGQLMPRGREARRLGAAPLNIEDVLKDPALEFAGRFEMTRGGGAVLMKRNPDRAEEEGFLTEGAFDLEPANIIRSDEDSGASLGRGSREARMAGKILNIREGMNDEDFRAMIDSMDRRVMRMSGGDRTKANARTLDRRFRQIGLRNEKERWAFLLLYSDSLHVQCQAVRHLDNLGIKTERLFRAVPSAAKKAEIFFVCILADRIYRHDGIVLPDHYADWVLDLLRILGRPMPVSSDGKPDYVPFGPDFENLVLDIALPILRDGEDPEERANAADLLGKVLYYLSHVRDRDYRSVFDGHRRKEALLEDLRDLDPDSLDEETLYLDDYIIPFLAAAGNEKAEAAVKTRFIENIPSLQRAVDEKNYAQVLDELIPLGRAELPPEMLEDIWRESGFFPVLWLSAVRTISNPLDGESDIGEQIEKKDLALELMRQVLEMEEPYTERDLNPMTRETLVSDINAVTDLVMRAVQFMSDHPDEYFGTIVQNVLRKGEDPDLEALLPRAVRIQFKTMVLRFMIQHQKVEYIRRQAGLENDAQYTARGLKGDEVLLSAEKERFFTAAVGGVPLSVRVTVDPAHFHLKLDPMSYALAHSVFQGAVERGADLEKLLSPFSEWNYRKFDRGSVGTYFLSEPVMEGMEYDGIDLLNLITIEKEDRERRAISRKWHDFLASMRLVRREPLAIDSIEDRWTTWAHEFWHLLFYNFCGSYMRKKLPEDLEYFQTELISAVVDRQIFDWEEADIEHWMQYYARHYFGRWGKRVLRERGPLIAGSVRRVKSIVVNKATEYELFERMDPVDAEIEAERYGAALLLTVPMDHLKILEEIDRDIREHIRSAPLPEEGKDRPESVPEDGQSLLPGNTPGTAGIVSEDARSLGKGLEPEVGKISVDPGTRKVTFRNHMPIDAFDLPSGFFGGDPENPANPLRLLHDSVLEVLKERGMTYVPLVSAMGSMTYVFDSVGRTDWDRITDLDLRVHGIQPFSEHMKRDVGSKLYEKLLERLGKNHVARRGAGGELTLVDGRGVEYPVRLFFTTTESLFQPEREWLRFRLGDVFYGDIPTLEQGLTLFRRDENEIIQDTEIYCRNHLRRIRWDFEDAEESGKPSSKILKRLYRFGWMLGIEREEMFELLQGEAHRLKHIEDTPGKKFAPEDLESFRGRFEAADALLKERTGGLGFAQLLRERFFETAPGAPEGLSLGRVIEVRGVSVETDLRGLGYREESLMELILQARIMDLGEKDLDRLIKCRQAGAPERIALKIEFLPGSSVRLFEASYEDGILRIHPRLFDDDILAPEARARVLNFLAGLVLRPRGKFEEDVDFGVEAGLRYEDVRPLVEAGVLSDDDPFVDGMRFHSDPLLRKRVAEFLIKEDLENHLIGPDKTEYEDVYREVREALDRLLIAAGIEPGNIRFYLGDSSVANAYYLRSSNVIVLNLGILRLLSGDGPIRLSKDAIAFILAHEMQHFVQYRESVLAGPVDTNMELVPDWTLADLLDKKKQEYLKEYDSDWKALGWMSKAGFNVQEAPRVFRALLEEMEKTKDPARRQIYFPFGSHPELELRTMDLEKKVREYFWENSGDADRVEPFPGGMTVPVSRFRQFQQEVYAISSDEDFIRLIGEARDMPELLLVVAVGREKRKQGALKGGYRYDIPSSEARLAAWRKIGNAAERYKATGKFEIPEALADGMREVYEELGKFFLQDEPGYDYLDPPSGKITARDGVPVIEGVEAGDIFVIDGKLYLAASASPAPGGGLVIIDIETGETGEFEIQELPYVKKIGVHSALGAGLKPQSVLDELSNKIRYFILEEPLRDAQYRLYEEIMKRELGFSEMFSEPAVQIENMGIPGLFDRAVKNEKEDPEEFERFAEAYTAEQLLAAIRGLGFVPIQLDAPPKELEGAYLNMLSVLKGGGAGDDFGTMRAGAHGMFLEAVCDVLAKKSDLGLLSDFLAVLETLSSVPSGMEAASLDKLRLRALVLAGEILDKDTSRSPAEQAAEYMGFLDRNRYLSVPSGWDKTLSPQIAGRLYRYYRMPEMKAAVTAAFRKYPEVQNSFRSEVYRMLVDDPGLSLEEKISSLKELGGQAAVDKLIIVPLMKEEDPEGARFVEEEIKRIIGLYPRYEGLAESPLALKKIIVSYFFDLNIKTEDFLFGICDRESGKVLPSGAELALFLDFISEDIVKDKHARNLYRYNISFGGLDPTAQIRLYLSILKFLKEKERADVVRSFLLLLNPKRTLGLGEDEEIPPGDLAEYEKAMRTFSLFSGELMERQGDRLKAMLFMIPLDSLANDGKANGDPVEGYTVRGMAARLQGHYPERFARWDMMAEGEKDPLAFFAFLNEIFSGKTFEEAANEITSWFPEGFFRDMMLYVLFADKVLSGKLGVEVTGRTLFDFPALRAAVAGRESEIREDLQTLIKGLSWDRKIQKDNGAYFAQTLKKDCTLTPQYFLEKDAYQNVLFYDVGGAESQLSLLSASLDEAYVNEYLEDPAYSARQKLDFLSRYYVHKSGYRDGRLAHLADNILDSVGAGTMPFDNELRETLGGLLDLLQNDSLREQIAVRMLEESLGSIRKIKGTVSKEDELAEILRFLPDFSFSRDEVLKQYEARHVRNDKDRAAISGYLVQDPENVRQKGSGDYIFWRDQITKLILNMNAKEKAEFLMWMMGIGEKPLYLMKLEYRYQISFEGLKKNLGVHSGEFYTGVGRQNQEEFFNSLFLGETGLFAAEAVYGGFIGDLIAKFIPPEKKAVRELIGAVLNAEDLVRRQRVLMGFLRHYGEIEMIGDKARRDAVAARVFLESMGFIGVKLGQFFAHSPFVTKGSPLAEELEKLKDSAEPMEKGIAIDMLLKIYGERAFEDIFESLDDLLGSASIKVVYQAKLKDGRTVVVKFKRPEIDKEIRKDLEFLQAILERFGAGLEEEGVRIPPGFMERIKTLIEEELDFNREGENQRRMGEEVSGRRTTERNGITFELSVPNSTEVHQNSLMVEEFADGTSLKSLMTDPEARMKAGISEETVRDAKWVLFGELMQEILGGLGTDKKGFYHADLHSGNVKIEAKGGKLIVHIIDLGAASEISPENREALVGIVLGLMRKDEGMVLRYFPHVAENGELTDALRTLIASDADPFSKLMGLFSALELHGVSIDPEFYSVFRFLKASDYLFPKSPEEMERFFGEFISGLIVSRDFGQKAAAITREAKARVQNMEFPEVREEASGDVRISVRFSELARIRQIDLAGLGANAIWQTVVKSLPDLPRWIRGIYALVDRLEAQGKAVVEITLSGGDVETYRMLMETVQSAVEAVDRIKGGELNLGVITELVPKLIGLARRLGEKKEEVRVLLWNIAGQIGLSEADIRAAMDGAPAEEGRSLGGVNDEIVDQELKDRIGRIRGVLIDYIASGDYTKTRDTALLEKIVPLINDAHAAISENAKEEFWRRLDRVEKGEADFGAVYDWMRENTLMRYAEVGDEWFLTQKTEDGDGAWGPWQKPEDRLSVSLDRNRHMIEMIRSGEAILHGDYDLLYQGIYEVLTGDPLDEAKPDLSPGILEKELPDLMAGLDAPLMRKTSCLGLVLHDYATMFRNRVKMGLVNGRLELTPDDESADANQHRAAGAAMAEQLMLKLGADDFTRTAVGLMIRLHDAPWNLYCLEKYGERNNFSTPEGVLKEIDETVAGLKTRGLIPAGMSEGSLKRALVRLVAIVGIADIHTSGDRYLSDGLIRSVVSFVRLYDESPSANVDLATTGELFLMPETAPEASEDAGSLGQTLGEVVETLARDHWLTALTGMTTGEMAREIGKFETAEQIRDFLMSAVRVRFETLREEMLKDIGNTMKALEAFESVDELIEFVFSPRFEEEMDALTGPWRDGKISGDSIDWSTEAMVPGIRLAVLEEAALTAAMAMASEISKGITGAQIRNYIAEVRAGIARAMQAQRDARVDLALSFRDNDAETMREILGEIQGMLGMVFLLHGRGQHVSPSQWRGFGTIIVRLVDSSDAGNKRTGAAAVLSGIKEAAGHPVGALAANRGLIPQGLFRAMEMPVVLADTDAVEGEMRKTCLWSAAAVVVALSLLKQPQDVLESEESLRTFLEQYFPQSFVNSFSLENGEIRIRMNALVEAVKAAKEISTAA